MEKQIPCQIPNILPSSQHAENQRLSKLWDDPEGWRLLIFLPVLPTFLDVSEVQMRMSIDER